MTDQAVCPFLGTLDADRNRAEHIDYPSFENRCWAMRGSDDARDMLMLTDQATYCLGGSHRLCPRYVAAQASTTSATAAAGSRQADFHSDWLNSDLDEIEEELNALEQDRSGRRDVWSWLAAGALFLTVVAVGSLLALYAGWHYVRGLQSADGGSLETLSAAQVTQQPLFLVMTATVPPAETATPTPGAVMVAPPATPNFPPAVTATSAAGVAPGDPANNVIVVDPLVTQAPPALPTTPPATSTPVFDLGQPLPEAPTRRPTPDFEIPTSTPAPNEPAPSATPQPIYGPPVVVFKADAQELQRDECTTVRWAVQNVREVYYEGIGVPGDGEREECMFKEDEEYTLMVVLPNGQSEVHTVTIAYLAPTPTATYTATVTPTPYFTPTWTPAPPPGTPTPILTFGVTIGVEGSTDQSCDRGQVCNATLAVTNLGSANDSLAVILESGDQWSPQVCRLDGVCSNNMVVINNVGPGNTGYVNFRLNIPADAQPQSINYSFVGASGNTSNAVRSDPVTLTINSR
jgi:hypothetical protein